MSDVNKLLETLSKIAELAQNPCNGGSALSGSASHSPDVPGCSIKAVPTRLLRTAAARATQINPANAPMMGVMDPLSIAVSTTKYWGASPRQLTVSFMDSASSARRAKILSHMNAWSQNGGVSFVETSGTGQVRITFGNTGHWSYLGIDILSIPANRPTMNLQQFHTENRESEFFRVVRHEAGHTLGFVHEHMRREVVARIDRQKAYQYFWATQGWNQAMVDAQVLTPLDDNNLYRTKPDQTSIMCYQLPGSITIDGNPIIGGTDINQTDHAFNALIYPKPSGQVLTPGMVANIGAAQAPAFAAATTMVDDWPESEDVSDIAV